MGKSNSEFWEAYRDPRWLEKRARIIDQRGRKCERCSAAMLSLDVHHRFYIAGNEPWEYEDSCLVCLCRSCHDIHHALVRHLKEMMGFLEVSALSQLHGYVAGLLLQQKGKDGDGVMPTMDGPERDAWCRGMGQSFVDKVAARTSLEGT